MMTKREREIKIAADIIYSNQVREMFKILATETFPDSVISVDEVNEFVTLSEEGIRITIHA